MATGPDKLVSRPRDPGALVIRPLPPGGKSPRLPLAAAWGLGNKFAPDGGYRRLHPRTTAAGKTLFSGRWRRRSAGCRCWSQRCDFGPRYRGSFSGAFDRARHRMHARKTRARPSCAVLRVSVCTRVQSATVHRQAAVPRRPLSDVAASKMAHGERGKTGSEHS